MLAKWPRYIAVQEDSEADIANSAAKFASALNRDVRNPVHPIAPGAWQLPCIARLVPIQSPEFVGQARQSGYSL
jgi:hypothetical protein